MRATLCRIEEDKWIFLYVMHHIISDGWSINILIRELLQFYNFHITGTKPPLSPLRIQYKDYAVWQQQQLKDGRLQMHEQYWRKQFEGELPVLSLLGDKGRPAVKTYEGDVIHMVFTTSINEGIKSLARQQGATLFMGILTAIYTLLYRYTDQDDIVVGTPIAGRDHLDLEDQLGLYVNMLA
ncbi:MAG: condensation domain-containing protein, partial [Bacteroidota bacterium]